ncbi:MAG: PilZ domain-containing protein [Nitrospira sp.]|uniref:PilZ domain-containing protein n=1 Tax=Nitrospira defluvii TaxID=330214 RepID=A0ABN7LLP0_9BACT|nr:PilZ domain-containing protein [Nitrospira defluvii]MCS6328370.1 PilZ domain-containing protein [Nitrospira sp.]CAE6757775.1 PilZ domain-containing protein [Nitrospira defluvii]
MAKRKSTRVEMNRLIELQGPRGVSQGVVRDFSPGGCRIQQADVKVNCGMRLTLRISLPDRIDPIEIKPSVVTWVGKDAFGVEFLSLSTETRARVKAVHELLLEAQTAHESERVISLPGVSWTSSSAK